ncbi:MAG: 4'-phosphopantetheinyl transferase superfamily protein [Myxacorys californica WJT36-NPBG1]|jgi:4'-phosphopantetheinyl transferase|nr:4'-phosphopantetheinyl transferase superfamily protein [Myxacorys californica WJT36-NPBG1]
MDWQAPPDELTLEPNDVHIWQARLDVPPAQVKVFAQTLSADEHKRARRFKFEVHRDRFIAGRGILRLLLSRYLGCSPDGLTFGYALHGKPMLLSVQRSQFDSQPSQFDSQPSQFDSQPLQLDCQPSQFDSQPSQLDCQPSQFDSQPSQFDSQPSHLDCQSLQFNVAHSQDFALYAFSRDRLVGIDVEQIRPVDNLESLTRRFFLPSEHAAICSADPDAQARLFFRYWTCKESFLKATGDGLGKLGELEIALPMAQAAQLKRLPADQQIQDWHLQELDLGEFVGAISAKRNLEKTTATLPGQSLNLRQFSFFS